MASQQGYPVQGPQPQPEPIPFTIRLLHDHLSAPKPSSPGDSDGGDGGGGPAPKPKNDSFYKAWDKFMAASHKSESSAALSRPSTADEDEDTASPGTRGNAAGILAAATMSDTDSPARPDETNKGLGQK